MGNACRSLCGQLSDHEFQQLAQDEQTKVVTDLENKERQLATAQRRLTIANAQGDRTATIRAFQTVEQLEREVRVLYRRQASVAKVTRVASRSIDQTDGLVRLVDEAKKRGISVATIRKHTDRIVAVADEVNDLDREMRAADEEADEEEEADPSTNTEETSARMAAYLAKMAPPSANAAVEAPVVTATDPVSGDFDLHKGLSELLPPSAARVGVPVATSETTRTQVAQMLA